MYGRILFPARPMALFLSAMRRHLSFRRDSSCDGKGEVRATTRATVVSTLLAALASLLIVDVVQDEDAVTMLKLSYFTRKRYVYEICTVCSRIPFLDSDQG